MIVAVILNHNKPANADKLFELLDGVFDKVELWDSGSDPDKIPMNVTESFDNIYWAGAWREIIKRYSDARAVWMVGCDITLQDVPAAYMDYLKGLESLGCWSPCINGRAHPFMLGENYKYEPMRVRNIEGMAMAMSGELMRHLGDIPFSKYGFGLDYWFCHRARAMSLPNIIDGRVSVSHPPGIGYNEKEAHDEMEQVFGELFGENFRRTIFEYDETYEGNLVKDKPKVTAVEPLPDGACAIFQKENMKMLTIVTVDNGWGVDDFIDITEYLNVDKVLLQKGTSSLSHLARQGIKVVPYTREDDIASLIKVADIALFTKVGPANEKEYRQMLEAGVPVVVNVNHSKGAIEHEKNGFLYGNATWAQTWLIRLIDDPAMRDAVKRNTLAAIPEREPELSPAPPLPSPLSPEPPDVPVREEIPESFLQAMREMEAGQTMPLDDSFDGPLVTVITPTRERDLKMVQRSLEVMQLQYEQDWEQLICSNGLEEPQVRELVRKTNDERVAYHWCDAPLGDYGNYARKAMLEVARGKYVLMLDDDNYIMPEYIRMMVEALEASNADFAVCRVMHFGPLNEAVLGKPPVVLGTDRLEVYHIDILQFLMRREAILDIGWDEANGYISEVSLEKLAKKYRGVEIPLVLGVHV